MMETTLYRARRKAVADSMEDMSVLFLFAGMPKQKTLDQDYPFSVNRNFYYLTGLDTPEYLLYLTKIGGKITETVALPRPDPYLERYHGKMPTAEELRERTGAENAIYLDKLDWELGRLFSRTYLEHLYLDFHKRELDTVAYSEHDLALRIREAHPYLRLHAISRTIDNLRRVKSSDEVEKIREAVRLTGLGIEAILTNMAPGVGEWQLQAHFEFAMKMNGAMGHAFSPIIAAGANSVSLHYERNDQRLKDGDVLLLDLGAEFGYYSADISRTFPVNGTFTDEQRLYYNAVLHAQRRIVEALKPGLHIDDTLAIARDALYEYCAGQGLPHTRADMDHLLPHGVVHYLGLDTHDVGDRVELQPGMTVAIEPGIYLPERGLGIRIEDDAIITADGCELLSSQILKTPEEIELFVKEKGKAVNKT